jgi:hypothetical protein
MHTQRSHACKCEHPRLFFVRANAVNGRARRIAVRFTRFLDRPAWSRPDPRRHAPDLIRGFVTAIHAFGVADRGVDARDKRDHDGREDVGICLNSVCTEVCGGNSHLDEFAFRWRQQQSARFRPDWRSGSMVFDLALDYG